MDQRESGAGSKRQDPADASFPNPPAAGWLPAQRRELILNALLRESVVRVPYLARMMGTTEITVRRDLNNLARAGLVRRVRGGALAVKSLDFQGQSAESFTVTSSYTSDPALTDIPKPSVRTNVTSKKKAGRKGNPDRTSSARGTNGKTNAGVSSLAMDEASSRDRATVVRRSRIGVALPEPSFIWPSVTDAIRRMAAEKFGLEIVAKETSYETFPEIDILDDLATDPQMLGLIMAPSIEPDVAPETWQWLTECQLPVTILERHPPQWLPGFFDSVHTDHPAGVRRGLQHFRQHGHHRVGLALGSTPTAGDIELGWQLMMKEGGGLEQTFLLKDKQPYAAEDVEQIVQTILETHTTAVLVHPDYLSIALVQALERRGCHIPNDLSMITIDGYTKRLTVLRSSAQDLATAALRLQVRRIQDPDQRIEHLYIEPELIDRGSVADTADE